MLFSIHKKIFAQTIFCYCTKISDFAQICETYGQLSPRRYGYDSRGALPVAGESDFKMELRPMLFKIIFYGIMTLTISHLNSE